MEDINIQEPKLTVMIISSLLLIPNLVRKLNGIRLSNKNKWVMGDITLIDLPNSEPCKARLRYKMYNTWVQILELEVITGEEISRIRDSSPMGMKPTTFKNWLKESIQYLLRSIAYDKTTDRLSTNS